jgi:hypothetical protein
MRFWLSGANVATVQGSLPTILRHSRIWAAANVTVLKARGLSIICLATYVSKPLGDYSTAPPLCICLLSFVYSTSYLNIRTEPEQKMTVPNNAKLIKTKKNKEKNKYVWYRYIYIKNKYKTNTACPKAAVQYGIVKKEKKWINWGRKNEPTWTDNNKKTEILNKIYHFMHRIRDHNKIIRKEYCCSARDWDGKDYLRIIPRVVW